MANLPSTQMYPTNAMLPSYFSPGAGPGGTSFMPSDSSGMGMDAGGDGGGGGGFDPLSLVPGAGSFLSSMFSSIMAKKRLEMQLQAEKEMQQNSIQAQEGANTQSLAFNESQLDPFRQQMAQGNDVASLDKLERASYTPVKVSTAGGPGAPFTRTGGYSYTKSPELVQAAGDLKKSILAGNGAPTMTNPANYGKTSALDLLSTAAGTKDPTKTSAFASGAPAAASTLGSDAAANAIRQAYQLYLQRDPTDAEILSQTGNGSFSVSDPRLQLSINNIKRAGAGQTPAAAAANPGGFRPSYAGAR